MAEIVTTYFGDYLLGLFVTWTSEPSADGGGTSAITIDFTANMRSKLHVYGYTGTDTTLSGYSVDVEADWMDSDTGLTDVFVTYDAEATYTTTEKFDDEA